MSPKADIWCVGIACPWCVLDVTHGDYEEAQRSYRQSILGPSLQTRTHLANVAWHAISDIVEQAQQRGMDPKIDIALEQPPHAAHNPPHCILSPQRIRASAATGSPGGGVRSMSFSSASAWLGDPPEKKTRVQWSGDHAASASRKKAKKEEPPPIPPERACFQVWGGKATKWITYDDPTQEILREAYKRHGVATFHGACGKRHYEVNTDPDVMTQKRTDLPSDVRITTRSVRVILREDDLFEV